MQCQMNLNVLSSLIMLKYPFFRCPVFVCGVLQGADPSGGGRDPLGHV